MVRLMCRCLEMGGRQLLRLEQVVVWPVNLTIDV